MIPFKKEKGIVAATAGILSSAMLAPAASGHEQVAPASQVRAEAAGAACSPIGNCYGWGETDGFIVDGAAARFDVREYTAPDWEAGGHTNHALWVGVESTVVGPGAEWCEIGWTKGYPNEGNPGGPLAGYYHYGAYYVDEDYEDFLLYYGLTIGNSYHYQILREYDGKYNLYINNTDVGDCYADPFTLYIKTGLEYTHPNAKAARNDPRELEWRRATDLVWFDWGSLGTAWRAYEASNNGAAQWRWEEKPTHGEDWTTN